jgi:hypothetical protein
MKRSQTQLYQMLTRVVAFANANESLFPKTSAASEVVAALESAASELSAQASARVSGEAATRTASNARKAARNALRTRLYLYEQAGSALESGKFRAPRKRTDMAMIETAHAFAVEAEPLKKEFTRHGLLPDELTVLAEALEHAILDYTAGMARRAAAIREFDKTLEDSMVQLQRFEVLVATFLADNPGAMASWTVARTINQMAVRKRIAKPPDVNPVAPAPPPAAQAA